MSAVIAAELGDRFGASVRTIAAQGGPWRSLSASTLLVTVKAVDDPSSAASERPVDDAGLDPRAEWIFLRGEPPPRSSKRRLTAVQT